jgi:hypothetical protein
MGGENKSEFKNVLRKLVKITHCDWLKNDLNAS